jgi:ABC-type phosphate/phosphonate transport system substrate-binding protein
MKLFVNCLFLATLSLMIISCGGGSSNSNEVQVEINTQATTDSSTQNTQEDTKKVIEEIPIFENAKFDEAIFN